MSEAWIPVLFAAVVVIGAVGGSLAQMVLKEILPLLRSLAEQRKGSPPADLALLTAELEAMRARVADLETDQHRLADETRFLTRLLAERSAQHAEHDTV